MYLLGLTGLACLLFAGGGLVYTLSGRDATSASAAPPVIAKNKKVLDPPLEMPQASRAVAVAEVLHGADSAALTGVAYLVIRKRYNDVMGGLEEFDQEYADSAEDFDDEDFDEEDFENEERRA